MATAPTAAARDKLSEARFFLDKMNKMKDGTGREFRYYLSAFLSAARSVTWALQASLRSRVGFDRWYMPRQKALQSDRIARIVKLSRNSMLKKGNQALAYTHTLRNPTNPREWLSATMRVGEDLSELRFGIEPSRLPPCSVLVDPNRPVQEQLQEIDDQVGEWLQAVGLEALSVATEELMQTGEEEVMIALLDESPIPAEALIGDLEGYLESLERLLSEAEAEFSSARDDP